MRDEGLDTLTIGFAMYYLRDPGSAPKPLDTDFFRFTRSAGRSKAFINLREASIVTYSYNVQGDPSRCSLGVVDMKTKVVF